MNENDSPPPILSQLSDDDFPWYYPAHFCDLLHFMMDPHAFVEELNCRLVRIHSSQRRPAETEESRSIILPENYLIRARLNDSDVDMSVHRPFLFHGISGTPLVTIRIKDENALSHLLQQLDLLLRPPFRLDGFDGECEPHPLAPPSERILLSDLEPWDDLWENWSNGEKSGPLEVGLVEKYGHGYGHLEIVPARLCPARRANRIAAFLIMGSLASDKSGPYLNRVITRTDAVSEMIDMETLSAVPTEQKRQCFRPITRPRLKKVTFTVAGRIAQSSSSDSDPTPTLPGCFDGSGRLCNGMIVLDEVVVKDYRLPPPKP